ncbi:TetR/AcrR family transcriptional regulator [Bacillus rugosus]|uniref:TetR/AcrR family transcriptional regulator n=1 Tax=Bacillus rugosus TaxID=2715209 RepID=UPI001420230C|nr:TetR/AcrR family transcriptional regulator [Bacillus rugosus]MEC1550084.1 TetR/AcrR family transcriptional regulator [Bacillus rugosus]NUF03975.1 TetR/AcrR family transcriptional regulator [Bacillus rugosus]
MTRENIKRTAVRQFNELGYEGVKMAHIAKELGIRKQSLSYHFSSKKDLLMEVYPEIVEEEVAFINDFFESRKHMPAKNLIYDFLKETQMRFHAMPNVAFLQAMSFKAPAEVSDFISAQYLMFLHALKSRVALVFKESGITCPPEKCAIAFITLFDGLNIQLVYENKQSFERSLEISFDIFWRGLKAKV